MSRMKVTAALVLACSAALLVAVTTSQARPAHSAASRAPTAPARSTCKIVIGGGPWRIRAHAAGGTVTGDRYTLVARNLSCSSVRALVTAFTHQRSSSRIKGPQGFRCTSFATGVSGDKLLYSDACMRPPHNDPFFEWGPKVR